MTSPKKAHLGLWLSYLDEQWQAPGSRAEEVNDIEPYADLARICEDAKLDALIRGDSLSLHRGLTGARSVGELEALILLTAIAARTSRIGLIGTVSTTFSDPYNLARQLSTLDHLSNGRIGWNIVTSATGERNFGYASLPDQDARYDRADEFLEVTAKLWSSWAADALPIDRESGVFGDHDKVHDIRHLGRHFAVYEALNVPRSPQGRPVLVQAGSSERGKQFAAAHAEVVFTAQREIASGQAFLREIKDRARAGGRDPGQIKVLPGLGLLLAETEEEAHDLQQRRLDGIDFDTARTKLEHLLGGADLSDLDLDERVPAARFPDASALTRRQSRPQIFIDLAVTQGFTLRRILQELFSTNGHGQFVGTPEGAADRIIEWLDADAADGFILFPSAGWRSIRLITERVVPILQERGRFRTEYEGTTLRDHFGLAPLPA